MRKHIDALFRVVGRYWEHVQFVDLYQGILANPGPNLTISKDLAKHRRDMFSARKAVLKIGRALAVRLEAVGTDSTGLLLFLNAVDSGGGPEAAAPLWSAVKVALQRLLILAEKAEAASGKSPDLSPQADHSDDFRSVNWFGETYSFSANQSLCVQLLWNHSRRGLDVGGSLLLEAAESAGEQPSDIFKRHPAWGTMIVPGGAKGTYRLSRRVE